MVGLVFVCEDFAAFCLSPRFTEDFETEVVILLPFFGSSWYSDSYHKRETGNKGEREEGNKGGKGKWRKGEREEKRNRRMNGRLSSVFPVPPLLPSSFPPFSLPFSNSKFCNLSRNA
jgi:hypothetical protein